MFAKKRRNMPTRVLHVFAPSLFSRFSGDSIWWKTAFERWDDHTVTHWVLDSFNNKLLAAKDAFQFEYSTDQKNTSRWERGVWVFYLFWSLVRNRKKYDVLHVHVLWWGSLLIAPWAKWNGIPAFYQSVLLGSDTPGSVSKEFLGQLKVWCLKLFKSILVISDYLGDDYRKSGFPSDRVFLLENCADDAIFFPVASQEEKMVLRQTLNLPLNAKVLVFVGSVIERKGVDVLIQAFIEAGASIPELFLVIVGPKDSKENPSMDNVFVEQLMSKAAQYGMGARICWMGLIQERTKLAGIYRASDIFVFPSRNEGLGNVVMEAMASGMPVIVSQLPVLEKIAVHLDNAFLVPIGSSDQLRDAILSLVEKPGLAAQLGQNAFDYIVSNHSFEIWQSRLSNFYKSLVAAQAPLTEKGLA